MSNEGAKENIQRHILFVKGLIQRCIQVEMSPSDIVQTLFEKAQIDPRQTELVLQELEKQNEEFFKAYYMKLMAKEQLARIKSRL